MTMYLLEPGFADDTVLYEIELKEALRLSRATVEEIEKSLDYLGVSRLVIDAGHPHLIERLRRKYMVQKLLRRKGGNDE